METRISESSGYRRHCISRDHGLSLNVRVGSAPTTHDTSRAAGHPARLPLSSSLKALTSSSCRRSGRGAAISSQTMRTVTSSPCRCAAPSRCDLARLRCTCTAAKKSSGRCGDEVVITRQRHQSKGSTSGCANECLSEVLRHHRAYLHLRI